MTITKLIVGGFKSIRELTEIPIAPLTFLFGPNSAGKSAVLEALDELAKKLIEVPEDHSQFTKAIRAFVGEHHSKAHRLARNAVDEESSHTSVMLGLELDEFPAGETNFRGDVDAARSMALALYRRLEGANVRLEFGEASSGLQFVASVAVDGEDLVGFADAATFMREYPTEAESPEPDPTLGLSVVPSLFSPRWDAVTIQLGHRLWAESALASKLSDLRRMVSATTSPFVRTAITVDGDSMTIRTTASLFHACGWGDRDCSERSMKDVCQHGIAGESAETTSSREHVLEVLLAVDLICASISFLVYQMRFIAHSELEFARVSGDRKVLLQEDVTTEFDIPQSGGLVRSRLQAYAAWLGILRAGEDVASAAEMAAARECDDFINDTLRRDFFPARGYQVRPEVWQITTTLLLERDASQSGDGGERLKVSLFLEDANGRLLDFSDVGSGVSYVMPVLASLWGAERSWIEQPELHLHPAAQCELGDVVLRAFNRGRFSIIETHSEHLLLRVLRRIRQTSNGSTDDPELRCHPESVSILYFEPLPDGGTRIRPIRVSRSGDFMDRWPQGFFAERDRELFDE